jgi:hypothetical protein
LKVTLNEQLEPTATLVPQVFVSVKSPPFAPVIPMLEILSAAVPLLLSVIVCTPLVVPTSWFPNVSGVGESPTEGAVPVPLRGTECGLPMALSVIVTDALLGPRAVGANVTLIVHAPPAATVVPQLFVWEKSLVFAPVIPMLETLRAPVPLSLSVMVRAALGVFIAWFPNASGVGESPTEGAVPVPVRGTI